MIAVSKPWLIYARVSTLGQARDGCSVEAQREAIGATLKGPHQRGESI